MRQGAVRNSKIVTFSKPPKNRTGLIICLIIAAVVVIAAVLFFLWGRNRQDIPGQLTVTVAWNPHSTADDMVRALAFGMETPLAIQNIPGANGANGLNAVYAVARDGENVLSTSLSAFVTAEAMGFGQSPRYNWVGWLCVFAPAIIAVPAGSPFVTMEDLTAALRQPPGLHGRAGTDDSDRAGSLICANSGFGTISFTAAELFREKSGFDFEHISHAGSSPAINALLNGDADFAVLPSTEIAGALRSGEIRALAAFSEGDFTIAEITIPSAAGISQQLDALLPFGEFYGIFIPADIPQSRLNGIEAEIQAAAASHAFAEFAQERGLAVLTPDRTQNARVIDDFCTHVCQTLRSARFLP